MSNLLNKSLKHSRTEDYKLWTCFCNFQRRSSTQVTEMLKACLQKVCELQASLQRTGEEENDAEAAGYAACAIETMRFLAAEGLPPDHPVVRELREKLTRDRDWFSDNFLIRWFSSHFIHLRLFWFKTARY